MRARDICRVGSSDGLRVARQSSWERARQKRGKGDSTNEGFLLKGTKGTANRSPGREPGVEGKTGVREASRSKADEVQSGQARAGRFTGSGGFYGKCGVAHMWGSACSMSY